MISWRSSLRELQVSYPLTCLFYVFVLPALGGVHESELTDDYCKRYFLVGLLLREVRTLSKAFRKHRFQTWRMTYCKAHWNSEINQHIDTSGRRGGLVASALDSGSKVRVRALARSLCCVLGQDTLLSQCLSPPRSINGYQQTVRETWQNNGGNLRWTSIPSRRSNNTPGRFMLRKPGKAPAVWATRLVCRVYLTYKYW